MNNTSEYTRLLLSLQCVGELSGKRKEKFLDCIDALGCGYSAAALCSDEVRALARKTLSEEAAGGFYRNLEKSDILIDKMLEKGVGWLTRSDVEYPEKLREIDGAPIILFLKGDAALLNRDIIAVVGTRKPTRYGAKIADSFSREFANAGLCVVSGFARGIDSIAHKACVDMKAPTIAVMACGLDVCYPAEHRGLYAGILSNGGLAVSEYPPGTKPLQYHFPERNRIISGLSRAVFLPEAAVKSGSLITVRLAIEQGREVFITPADIFSEEGAGSNAMLRQIPHAFVASADDVLDALRVDRVKRERETVELTLCESRIAEALKDAELHFEELLELTALDVADLNTALVNLEINGIIERTGGNYYVLS